MSERLLSILLTLAFFLLMVVWIPFLDLLARFARRQRQNRHTRTFRRAVEADLPNLYSSRPHLIRQNRQQVCMNDKP